MWSCGLVALAAGVAAPRQAHAQAFQGNPIAEGQNIAAFGNATRSITSSTTETITVGTPTAMINWDPTITTQTGNINFLPEGNIATFTSIDGLNDYTVLNRIVPTDPTRAIELNGTVISTLQGTSARGGKVWFYSPGGILVGSKAVFDVGSLLLTTLDPVGFTESANGFGRFTNQYDTAGNVQIANGARITAGNEGSYVALVAPRVVQGGDVTVNGQAAYVAAEDVTMTINDGLFNMEVHLGTRDTQGIVHTGTTTGPASTGAADPHRAYLVAVPKSQALTMLLGGTIGFQESLVPTVQNGEIVISAGYNVGVPTDTNGIPASIQFDEGNYTSVLTADATGSVLALADAGTIDFFDNIDIAALEQINFGASDGNLLVVNGNLTASVSQQGLAGDILLYSVSGGTVHVTGSTTLTADGEAVNGGSGTGGTVSLYASGGTITFDESATFSANGFNRDNSNEANGLVEGGLVNIHATGVGSTINFDELTATANASGQTVSGATIGTGSSAKGGTIYVTADTSGKIVAGSDSDLSASATGAHALNGASAGTAEGGTVSIYADSSGAMTFDGLTVRTDATGGNANGSGSTGFGLGGDIFVTVQAGDIDVLGDLVMSSNGIGGSSFSGSAFQPGATGTGGMARIGAPGTGSMAIAGKTTITSNGRGGSGQQGGAGLGGNAGIDSYAGTITLGTETQLAATGTGGNANVGFGGTGGLGEGGVAYLEALFDVEMLTAGTITGGSVKADASGFGGSGGASDGVEIAAGTGGEGRGGTYDREIGIGSGGAFVAADSRGGILDLGLTTVLADGTGGAGGVSGAGTVGGAGGDGFGGTAQAGQYDRGSPSGRADYDGISVSASGRGGNGGLGVGSDGVGGSGYGGGYEGNLGGAYLVGVGSVTITGNATLAAQGAGGNGSTGGDAVGGTSYLGTFGVADLVITGNLIVNVGAQGGTGYSGFGGNAWGGNMMPEVLAAIGGVTVNDSSSLDVDGTLSVLAAATGGAGTAGGGQAIGGWAYLDNYGADLDAGSVILNASATGGAGTIGTAAGGLALAGVAELHIEGGTTDFLGAASLLAEGVGGASNAGSGGDGHGGLAEFVLNGGTVNAASTLTISGNGRGGSGASGGDGYANTASIELNSLGGSLKVDGETNISAIGTGGIGTSIAGGDGHGGYASFSVPTELAPDATVALTFADLVVDGGAFGGNGIGGAAGGHGYGESASVDLGFANMTAGLLAVYAGGWGGLGGNAASGTGGAGGDGYGGSTTLVVGGNLTVDAHESYSWGRGRAGGTGSTQGAGGDAFGGSSSVTVTTGGKLTVTTDFVVNSGAIGGDGGIGGGALAGTAFVENYGTLSTVDAWVEAYALGGIGTVGAGGAAQAETAQLNNFGVLTSTGALEVFADAVGGRGVTEGGSAQGGSAGVSSLGTMMLGKLTIEASGTGGQATGGIGGQGRGGWALLSASDDLESGTDGSVTATGTVEILANGIGGAGTAAGGSGEGNLAGIEAYNGGSLALAGPLTRVSADGTGGAAPGGSGGNGSGGYASVLSYWDSSVTANNLAIDANGFGGAGAIGGDGFGGSGNGEVSGGAFAEADGLGSLLTLTGTATISATGSGGVGSSGNSGDGHGGDAGLAAYEGAVAAGAVTIVSNGNAPAGGSGWGGWSTLYAFGGGTLDAGLVALRADGATNGGTVSIAAGEAFTEVPGGSLTTAGIDATAFGSDLAGSVLLTVNSGGSADLGAVQLAANGALDGPGGVSVLVAGGAGTIPLTMDSLTISSSGLVDFFLEGGVGIGIAGTFFADTGNAMTFGHDGSGGTIVADQITLDVDALVNNLAFEALGIDLTIDGDFAFGDYTAQNNLSISAGGDLTGGALSAGNVVLSAGGDLIVESVSAGGSIALTAVGDIDAGTIDAGTTATAIAGGDLFLGDVFAGQSIVLTAAGTANLFGLASAPEITVTSADINIVGQLGEAGVTDLVTLNAVSTDQPIIIGGTEPVQAAAIQAAAVTGYRLSDGEEISGASIVFNAVAAEGAGPPDVILRSLEIQGSGGEGLGTNHVELNTPGSVFVEGLVLYTDAAASDLLAINAGESIIVNTTKGGRIAMIDANETPSGILELTASEIWVGDQALLDNLQSDPNFAGRDQALAANPGENNPDGTIIAREMALLVDQSLFVQNSGTADDFAGLTVGEGGLTIGAGGNTPATVVAFGRGINGDGSAISGDAFFDQITFQPASGGFSAASAFNGCSVGTGCFVAPPPPPPPPPPPGPPVIVGGAEAILGPVGLMGAPSESADDGLDEEQEDAKSTGVNVSTGLISTGSLSDDELIEEPVTSGGDSTQWLGGGPVGEEQ